MQARMAALHTPFRDASGPIQCRRRAHVPALLALLALLVVIGHSATANADENLEPKHPRDGFMIGLGAGPGFFLGMAGHGELLGVGAAFSLRVGSTAGANSLVILQLDNVAYLAADATDEKHTNVHSTLTVGFQRYLRELVWMKSGVGIATLAERQTEGTTETLSEGLALMGALGYDALHRGSIVLDLEVNLGVGIYGDGAIAELGAAIAINWY